MAFDVVRERHGGVMLLALQGRLDNENAADFELVIQEALAGGARHLVLDLADLEYLSNAGLRALSRIAKSLNATATSLRVAGASAALRQVFDASGASVLFEFHPDRAAALRDHPALRGAELATLVSQLLGLPAAPPAAAPTDPQHAKLAELALEILTTRGRQTRAVRALAQGTQVMQRVVTAQGGKAAAPRKDAGGFWQRLFGRRK